MINSRRKGKTQELRVVHWLKAHGFHSAERSVQYCGRSGDSSDVRVPVELPYLYIEVKSRKLMPQLCDLLDWMHVAKVNCAGKYPVLLVNILRAREPMLFTPEPHLDGLLCYYNNKIETLIRLNQMAAAEQQPKEAV